GLALIFLMQVVLARVVGSEGYGVYAYVTAWIGVMSIVARYGLDTAVLRDAGIYAARADWPAFQGLLRAAGKWAFAAGLLVGIVAVLVVATLVPADDVDRRATFWVGAMLLPVSAFAAVRQAA